jgi:hypothetical protein
MFWRSFGSFSRRTGSDNDAGLSSFLFLGTTSSFSPHAISESAWLTSSTTGWIGSPVHLSGVVFGPKLSLIASLELVWPKSAWRWPTSIAGGASEPNSDSKPYNEQGQKSHHTLYTSLETISTSCKHGCNVHDLWATSRLALCKHSFQLQRSSD